MHCLFIFQIPFLVIDEEDTGDEYAFHRKKTADKGCRLAGLRYSESTNLHKVLYLLIIVSILYHEKQLF